MHRGGNGVDVAYRFLEPGTIAIHDDRWLTYPWGVNGGEPGARGRKWLERADGTTQVLPSKIHDFPVNAGDLLHFVTWGGGGWGDPLARDPELVGLEVRRGLVTVEGARRYGVVCDEQGQVDGDATRAAARQAQGRASRPAADLQHGPAAGGDPGPVRGGDRPACAEATDRTMTERPGPRRGVRRHAPVRDGRPAVLAIDLMRAYFDPASPLCLPSRDCLASAARVLAAARATGVPVIHTRVEFAPGRQRRRRLRPEGACTRAPVRRTGR